MADTLAAAEHGTGPGYEGGHVPADKPVPSPSMAEALHAAAAAHHAIGEAHHEVGANLTHAANAIDGGEPEAPDGDDGAVAELLGGSAARSAVSAQARGLTAVRSNPVTNRVFKSATGRR